MNASAPVRPEERRRRHVESPAWADTVPACFRSEAFAEDLPELPAALPARPRPPLAGARDPMVVVAAQSAR